MALAIQFDGLLREGVVRNTTGLARRTHVTHPRITQVMHRLHLAPDIPVELLLLPLVERDRDWLTQKHLHRTAAEPEWCKQWAVGSQLKSRH